MVPFNALESSNQFVFVDFFSHIQAFDWPNSLPFLDQILVKRNTVCPPETIRDPNCESLNLIILD